ncbi:MAG: hypothetical protein LBL46_02090 [Rickettsiales bacterium]|jgi:hypothetical protein|nr:hypothetical protein [Rickettsiales bacterium]
MKRLFALLFMMLAAGSAFAGSGDSCTNVSGTGSEYWSNGAIGCNCNEDASLYVGTGFQWLSATYPTMGECQGSDGGWWKSTDAPCFPSQPLEVPEGMEARAARVGVCWDLWCGAGKYIMGEMGPAGERVKDEVRFDRGCEVCPAAEELFADYSDATKIVLMVRIKSSANYVSPEAKAAAEAEAKKE